MSSWLEPTGPNDAGLPDNRHRRHLGTRRGLTDAGTTKSSALRPGRRRCDCTGHLFAGPTQPPATPLLTWLVYIISVIGDTSTSRSWSRIGRSDLSGRANFSVRGDLLREEADRECRVCHQNVGATPTLKNRETPRILLTLTRATHTLRTPC